LLTIDQFQEAALGLVAFTVARCKQEIMKMLSPRVRQQPLTTTSDDNLSTIEFAFFMGTAALTGGAAVLHRCRLPVPGDPLRGRRARRLAHHVADLLPDGQHRLQDEATPPPRVL
jgi:hypothetical protein